MEADSRGSSRGSLEELPQLRHRDAPSALSASMRQKMLLDYSVYMAKYVNSQVASSSPTAAAAAAPESPGHSPASSPRSRKKVGSRGVPGSGFLYFSLSGTCARYFFENDVKS